MSQRQRFTKEFKAEAVRLLKHSGRPGVEIAQELGIRRNQLYKWAEQLEQRGDGAFPGPGRRPPVEEEVVRLRREVAQLREERDILKKAAAYFAKDLR